MSDTWDYNLSQWGTLLGPIEALRPAIERTGRVLIATLKAGGRVLACGNGGSASQAAHLCTELVGRYKQHRRGLAGLNLSADGSLLTCLINDFDPAEVFARQVEALGRIGDCVVGLSTSGVSINIARALTAARENELQTVALLGQSGPVAADRPAMGVAEHEIVVPHIHSARIQEAHLMIIHTWCDAIDAAFAAGA